MRKIKKLLQLVLEYAECHGFGTRGICWCVVGLSNERVINHEEYLMLVYYIRDNRPTEGEHFDQDFAGSSYYWHQGASKPRMAWLKDRINLEK
jgi:hypothetical protein